MTDLRQIRAVLARLRRMGVHMAVDDFGTGYSSLSYLHRLPVDELKIDRSFISQIHHRANEQHLVKAMVGMARALDLTVVAEGIETTEQLSALADLGCQVAQGYLFGRPMPPQDFLVHLQQHVATRAVVMT